MTCTRASLATWSTSRVRPSLLVLSHPDYSILTALDDSASVTDLVKVLSTLVAPSGEILIPGLKDTVAPLTDAERKRYEAINFSLSDIHASTGSQTCLSDDKTVALMGKMREPSLSIHGVEGAFYSAGAKTVIPATVIGGSRRHP